MLTRATILGGGPYTAGKKAFGPGRIEVCARMTQAQGAWPAIWMMPSNPTRGGLTMAKST